MGNRKTIAAVLLAVCLIAACAALPGLVSAYQDGRTLGQAQSETVPHIQLQIHGDEETPAMAKLARMCRMDGGLEISKSMASMTREEVQTRALHILQGYVDAGLVEVFDPVVLNCWCMLATVSEDPALNGVYWIVTLVNGDEQDFAQFDIALDDEKGTPLVVGYTREKFPAAQEQEAVLSAFADHYSSSLGILDYGAFIAEDPPYAGDNGTAVRYRFGDMRYGEISVELYVHEHGFYTEFTDPGVKG